MSKNIKNEDIKLIEDCYILGTLAVNEKVFPFMGEEQQVVTYLKKNPDYILFYIKSLSKLPKRLHDIPGIWDNNIFIGFDKALETIQMPPDYWYIQDVKEKKKYVMDKLSNKLVLFKPYIKRDEKNPKGEAYFRNLVVFDVEDAVFDMNKKYVPIPGPNMSCQEFERAMLQQTPIEFPLYNKEMDPPQVVVCEDYIYCNLKWSGVTNGKRTVQSIGEVKRFKMPEDFYNHIIYKVSDELIFVDEDYIDPLSSEVHSQSADLP